MDTSPLYMWPHSKACKRIPKCCYKERLKSCFGRSNRGLAMGVTRSTLQWNQSASVRQSSCSEMGKATPPSPHPIPVIMANPQSKQGPEITNWSFSRALFVYKQSYPAFLTIHLLLQLLHREHWNPPPLKPFLSWSPRTISQWQLPLGSWSLPCDFKKRAKQKTWRMQLSRCLHSWFNT